MPVVLSFDLEEFDIPLEYGRTVGDEEKFAVTVSGLMPLLALLERRGVTATFFTTGCFAERHPDLVRVISEQHEIASHAYYHAPGYRLQPGDILRSVERLEGIILRKIRGFRMPRLAPFPAEELRKAGISYDSSLNPTWLPGRYNRLTSPAVPFGEEGLWILPASVTPLLRIPLFWLSFKNLPLPFYTFLCRRTLRARKNLVLYFHPWEFADLKTYRLPAYVSRPDGAGLLDKLDRFIGWLQEEDVRFTTAAVYAMELEHRNGKS